VTSNPKETIDLDPAETADWLDSLDAVLDHSGQDRAVFLLRRLYEAAQRQGARPELPLTTDYVNTIPVEEEPAYPGDPQMEARIRGIIRWNAMAMVQRANTRFHGIGGHLSSYASSANLYEVGFNHFFRGKDAGGIGDAIYFQGHASPGIYSRAFLEGRIDLERVDRFRREAERPGLPSYPHPRLLPDFWEYPTVSMGIGPINSIYQARFLRYVEDRGLKNTSEAMVWCFVGDGECDEPETLGQLRLAAREGLDNLIFVINCNLQRLDGPVYGNGKIIQELEGVFRGAGWNVTKVIWGDTWDDLFARDVDGVLVRRMNEIVDGMFQRYTTASAADIRQNLFGTDPRLLELVKPLDDEAIRGLHRGGHCDSKIYAAYHRAVHQKNGKPTVILAHTVKGWGLGEAFEGSNSTHQKKEMAEEELRAFRDQLGLPVPDDQLKDAPFYHPGMDSPEVKYMLEHRRALGGSVPKRRGKLTNKLQLPGAKFYDEFKAGMKKGEASTTMVFTRLLSKLMRDEHIGKRVIPIVPDEARTFGMDALFSQVGIYSSKGQLYEPVDKGRLLYYRESKDGQVLEEGINEAGSTASFAAAATSYASIGEVTIPFYIFYSMFGFQRTGDQFWAIGDAMGRGFVLGGTAGRTTLNGEGLQHEDGHSQLLAATYPSVVAYDVSFAYELACIIQDGLNRMYEREENIYYYITLQNENYTMPALPAEGEAAQAKVADGIVRGIYKYAPAQKSRKYQVQLFGSGSIMLQVLRAQELLAERFDVAADVWAVTSYQQLRRDALTCERENRLHPERQQQVPYITRALEGCRGPFIAASDYMTLVQDQVARWIPGRYVPLGTDGFGMSDTREALRRHFEVDAECIAAAALSALHADGQIDAKLAARAIAELHIDPEKVYSART
jgi:pyruvate dehydrogenase E1 component